VCATLLDSWRPSKTRRLCKKSVTAHVIDTEESGLFGEVGFYVIWSWYPDPSGWNGEDKGYNFSILETRCARRDCRAARVGTLGARDLYLPWRSHRRREDDESWNGSIALERAYSLLDGSSVLFFSIPFPLQKRVAWGD